jgi:hypothetical protein
MAAHAANNALFLLVAYASRADDHAGKGQTALALVAGAAVCAGATAVLRSALALSAAR